nr:YfhE family protein [Lysinibacillus timonensis]
MKGKQPHEQLTTKDNGLTSMQEVIYRKEFKQMDNAANQNKQNQNENQNKKYNM